MPIIDQAIPPPPLIKVALSLKGLAEFNEKGAKLGVCHIGGCELFCE